MGVVRVSQRAGTSCTPTLGTSPSYVPRASSRVRVLIDSGVCSCCSRRGRRRRPKALLGKASTSPRYSLTIPFGFLLQLTPPYLPRNPPPFSPPSTWRGSNPPYTSSALVLFRNTEMSFRSSRSLQCSERFRTRAMRRTSVNLNARAKEVRGEGTSRCSSSSSFAPSSHLTPAPQQHTQEAGVHKLQSDASQMPADSPLSSSPTSSPLSSTPTLSIGRAAGRNSLRSVLSSDTLSTHPLLASPTDSGAPNGVSSSPSAGTYAVYSGRKKPSALDPVPQPDPSPTSSSLLHPGATPPALHQRASPTSPTSATHLPPLISRPSSSPLPSTISRPAARSVSEAKELLRGQNLKAEVQSLGLANESAGWAMVQKLASLGKENEWSGVLAALGSGKVRYC